MPGIGVEHASALARQRRECREAGRFDHDRHVGVVADMVSQDRKADD